MQISLLCVGYLLVLLNLSGPKPHVLYCEYCNIVGYHSTIFNGSRENRDLENLYNLLINWLELSRCIVCIVCRKRFPSE